MFTLHHSLIGVHLHTSKYMAEEGTTSINLPEKSQSSTLVPTSRMCRSGVEKLPGQRYGNLIDPLRTNCRYPEAQVCKRPHTSTELSTTTRVFVDPESYALEVSDCTKTFSINSNCCLCASVKTQKKERMQKRYAN